MENIGSRFVKKLHALRKDRLKITQTEAAERIGISLRYYQTLEKGESWPSAETFDAIEKGLQVSIADLISDDTAGAPVPISEQIERLARGVNSIKDHPLYPLLEITTPSQQRALLEMGLSFVVPEPPIGSLSQKKKVD